MEKERDTLFGNIYTRSLSLSLSLSLSKRVSRRRINERRGNKTQKCIFLPRWRLSDAPFFLFFACFSLLLFLPCLFVSCGEREDTFCGSNEAKKSTSFFFPLGFVLSFFVVTLTERTTREEEDQKQRATSTRKKRDKAPRVLFHCYSLFSSVTERLFDQKCSRTKRRRHLHHRALSHRTSKKAWRRYAAFWRKKPPGRRT